MSGLSGRLESAFLICRSLRYRRALGLFSVSRRAAAEGLPFSCSVVPRLSRLPSAPQSGSHRIRFCRRFRADCSPESEPCPCLLEGRTSPIPPGRRKSPAATGAYFGPPPAAQKFLLALELARRSQRCAALAKCVPRENIFRRKHT